MMNERLTQTVAPAAAAVDLEDAKHHLRVESDAEDQLIESQIATATDWAEDFTGRQLITATWKLTLDRWPWTDHIRLPRPPVTAITSVTYHKSDGTSATMDAADYELDASSDHANARLYLTTNADWPSDTLRRYAGIEVVYTAGYGDSSDDIPTIYRNAIQMVVGSLYENRETEIVGKVAAQIKFGAEALLWPKRIWA